jgi:hypothetical protein
MRTIKKATPLLLLVAAVLCGTPDAVQAAGCTGTEKAVALCVEGKQVLGTVPFSVSSSGGLGAVTLNWSGISIQCQQATGQGKFDPAASEPKIKIPALTLEFAGCTVSQSDCSVANERLTLEKLSGESTPSNFTFFPSENRTRFGTLILKSSGGTCLLHGEYAITTVGKKANDGPSCTLASIGEELAEHTIKCSGSASTIEIGGKPAELVLADQVKLAETYLDQKWSIRS